MQNEQNSIKSTFALTFIWLGMIITVLGASASMFANITDEMTSAISKLKHARNLVYPTIIFAMIALAIAFSMYNSNQTSIIPHIFLLLSIICMAGILGLLATIKDTEYAGFRGEAAVVSKVVKQVRNWCIAAMVFLVILFIGRLVAGRQEIKDAYVAFKNRNVAPLAPSKATTFYYF